MLWESQHLKRLRPLALAAFATFLHQNAAGQTPDAAPFLPTAVNKPADNEGIKIEVGKHGEVTLVTDGSTRRKMLERLFAVACPVFSDHG
jgi:hypothetical protein